MRLNSTIRFDEDYKVIRKLFISKKMTLPEVKIWIRNRGTGALVKSELEAKQYARTHSGVRGKVTEDSWKDEVASLKLMIKDE